MSENDSDKIRTYTFETIITKDGIKKEVEEQNLIEMKKIDAGNNDINNNNKDNKNIKQNEADNIIKEDSNVKGNLFKLKIVDNKNDDIKEDAIKVSQKDINKEQIQKIDKNEKNLINENGQGFIPIGLTKLEKYAYINPILQLLGGIEEFEKYFCKNSKDYSTKIETNKLPLLSFVTSRLYVNLYHKEEIKKKKIYNSKNFLKLLNELHFFLSDTEKTKINDILIFILNQLHDENCKKPKENSIIQKYDRKLLKEVIKYGIKSFKEENNSIITSTLNYFLLQRIKCPDCNNQYFDLKSFSTFELHISETFQKIMESENRTLSLKTCLDNEKIKMMNGNPFKFYCDVCNSYKTTKEISYSFYEINDKIIFMLDHDPGFDSDNFSFNIDFKIDEKIDLEKYMLNPNPNSKFELTCIISAEIKEKKYVCFSKSFINGKWYLYSDEYTEEKNNIGDIIKDHGNKRKYIPYILMYNKIH